MQIMVWNFRCEFIGPVHDISFDASLIIRQSALLGITFNDVTTYFLKSITLSSPYTSIVFGKNFVASMWQVLPPKCSEQHFPVKFSRKATKAGDREPYKVQFSEKELREKLTPQEYHVTQERGTERAFTGELWDNKEPGVYRCVVCGKKLFLSDTKFESGSGWPSFYETAEDGNVRKITDTSHGMTRIEVTCADCGSHLGHVFDDGPRPTGQRYCMNSASLKFEPSKGIGKSKKSEL